MILKIKQNLSKDLISTFGIGKKTSIKFFENIGVNLKIKPRNLKLEKLSILSSHLENESTGKKLKLQIKECNDFTQKIKTYKGIRNKLKYPCRGQRTHTNGKTKKKFKVQI
jgi:small subunit ribosomal protein S13